MKARVFRTVGALVAGVVLLGMLLLALGGGVLEVDAQGKVRYVWLITKKLTVQNAADLQDDVDVGGDLDVTDDATVGDDLTVTDNAEVGGDLALTGNFSARSLMLRLQDVADDASNNVRAAAGVISTTSSITTSITNPDYPRNVKVTYQTVTTATAGSFTVTGVDARGEATTDVLAVGAISGTQTLTGLVPWASVTSFTMPGSRTEAVTLTVGLGEKFGLPLLPVVAGDVFMVTVGNVFTTAYTVNTTYGTVLPTADVAANDDFTIWVKQ